MNSTNNQKKGEPLQEQKKVGARSNRTSGAKEQDEDLNVIRMI